MGEITMTTMAGESATTAMLQGLVANQGDGWAWFLGELGRFYRAVAERSAPDELPVAGLLDQPKTERSLQGLGGGALLAAALLGSRTAEMHLALATPTQDPAFSAEPLTTEHVERDVRRLEAQLAEVLEILKMRFSTLDDANAEAVAQLLARRRELFARTRELTGMKAAGQCIRIHGDYHLGQTLRTGGHEAGHGTEADDFVILDFEGEPARALPERRRKKSPLKDVAGMLRSFSYAAHSALLDFVSENTGQHGIASESLRSWALAWERTACSEFLRAYTKTIAAKPELVPQSAQAQLLLQAYLLEKALYEVMYELNNRPTWLRIPVAGILAL